MIRLSETVRPPKKNSQNPNMFRRGNATSGAPICSGMIALPKPTNNGVANRNSMIVPCIVNSWLYCSRLTNCMPGDTSSARMISAMTPAITK